MEEGIMYFKNVRNKSVKLILNWKIPQIKCHAFNPKIKQKGKKMLILKITSQKFTPN